MFSPLGYNAALYDKLRNILALRYVIVIHVALFVRLYEEIHVIHEF